VGVTTDLPVAILCGGMGTRLREETEARPKPMVEIGGMPILWHIMRSYAAHGYTRFVLCLGYKGRQIKSFFMQQPWLTSDFTLRLGSGVTVLHSPGHDSSWSITFLDTGEETPTGGRLVRARRYLEGRFLATYGDGVSDLNITALVRHHETMGATATVTGIKPASPFGVIQSQDGMVSSFKEKPRLDGLVNGGFFVFEQGIFDVLSESSVLEEDPLRALASERRLSVYEHPGFWACMDTFKDAERLRAMWDRGERPWAPLPNAR
jgi:glucose-1-phosphate cytidylyltransferase